MLLKEAKEVLNKNGYIIFESDDGTWRSAVELCINYKGMKYSTLRSIRDMFEAIGGEDCTDYIEDSLYGCTIEKVGLKDKLEKIKKLKPTWYNRIKIYNNSQLNKDITNKYITIEVKESPIKKVATVENIKAICDKYGFELYEGEEPETYVIKKPDFEGSIDGVRGFKQLRRELNSFEGLFWMLDDELTSIECWIEEE